MYKVECSRKSVEKILLEITSNKLSVLISCTNETARNWVPQEESRKKSAQYTVLQVDSLNLSASSEEHRVECR